MPVTRDDEWALAVAGETVGVLFLGLLGLAAYGERRQRGLRRRIP